MRPLWVVIATLVVLACAPVLPSETPLGQGPLAKKEAEALAKAEKARDANAKVALGSKQDGDAPPSVEAPPPSVEPPPAPTGTSAEPPKPEGPGKKEPGKKPAAVSVVYAGEYVGSDTSNYKMQGNERSEKDDKARTRVEGGAPEISVTFIDSGTGKDICTLKGKTNGKSVSFAAGQKCWGEGPGMSGTLTQGSAKFEDKKLSIDMDFDLVIGEGDMRMTGTLHYHYEGTRK